MDIQSTIIPIPNAMRGKLHSATGTTVINKHRQPGYPTYCSDMMPLATLLHIQIMWPRLQNK